MVTVIIGVGVMGMLQLLASGTIANNESAELTTAVQLANNINEWTVRLAYDDLRTVGTYAGRTYTPPVDGRGQPLSGFDGWSQRVQVRYVDANNVGFEVPDTQVEPVSRVTVTVLRHGQPVHTAAWLAGKSPAP